MDTIVIPDRLPESAEVEQEPCRRTCISVREAAKRLAVSKSYLYERVNRGEFEPAVWVGARITIDERRLNAFIARGGDRSTGSAPEAQGTDGLAALDAL